MTNGSCVVCNQHFNNIVHKSTLQGSRVSSLSHQEKLWKFFCDYFTKNQCQWVSRKSQDDNGGGHKTDDHISEENSNSDSETNSHLEDHLDLEYLFFPFCPDCQKHVEELHRLDTVLEETRQKIKTVSAHISATLVQSYTKVNEDVENKKITNNSTNCDSRNSCSSPRKNKRQHARNEEDEKISQYISTVIKNTRRRIYQHYQPFISLPSCSPSHPVNETESNREEVEVEEEIFEVLDFSTDDDNNNRAQSILRNLVTSKIVNSDTIHKKFIVMPTTTQTATATTNFKEVLPLASASSSFSPSPPYTSSSLFVKSELYLDEEPEQEQMSTITSENSHSHSDANVQFHMDEDLYEEEGSDYVDDDSSSYCNNSAKEQDGVNFYMDSNSASMTVFISDDETMSDDDGGTISINEAGSSSNNSNTSQDQGCNVYYYEHNTDNMPHSSSADIKPGVTKLIQVDDTIQEEDKESNRRVIMTNDELHTLSIQEIMSRLGPYNVSKEQISAIKKIRRKERNRLSAKRSRERAFQNVCQLEQEISKYKLYLPSRLRQSSSSKRATPKKQNRRSILGKDLDTQTKTGTEADYNIYYYRDLSSDSCNAQKPGTMRLIQEGTEDMEENLSDDRQLVMSTEDIRSLPLEALKSRLAAYSINEEQWAIVRDIRRRERNRICAQNSRNRFRQHVLRLEEDVKMFRAKKNALTKERQTLILQRNAVEDQYKLLYETVIQALLEESGDYSKSNLSDYSLKELANGDFVLQPKQKIRQPKSFPKPSASFFPIPTHALDLTKHEASKGLKRKILT